MKTSYLRPNVKFDFNKKNWKDTKKKIQKSVRPCINSPVLNKTASLPLDTKMQLLKPNATVK